jgi:hypothetical protein
MDNVVVIVVLYGVMNQTKGSLDYYARVIAITC